MSSVKQNKVIHTVSQLNTKNMNEVQRDSSVETHSVVCRGRVENVDESLHILSLLASLLGWNFKGRGGCTPVGSESESADYALLQRGSKRKANCLYTHHSSNIYQINNLYLKRSLFIIKFGKIKEHGEIWLYEINCFVGTKIVLNLILNTNM